MKRRRPTGEKLTYAYVTILNIGVGALFFVLLTSKQVTPIVADVMVFSNTSSMAIDVLKQQKPIVGIPGRVVVPSVGIDQTVRPGVYDSANKTWTVDSTAAFHATTTVPANNANGTTLIYGHAEWGIFGRLVEVGPGAEAYVYTPEGYRFMYVYESSRQVDPTDVSALTALGSPKLLMQTCSGPFDIYRTLVTFGLKGVTRDA